MSKVGKVGEGEHRMHGSRWERGSTRWERGGIGRMEASDARIGWASKRLWGVKGRVASDA